MIFSMSLRNVLFNHHLRKTSSDSELIMGRKRSKRKPKLPWIVKLHLISWACFTESAEDKEVVGTKKNFFKADFEEVDYSVKSAWVKTSRDEAETYKEWCSFHRRRWRVRWRLSRWGWVGKKQKVFSYSHKFRTQRDHWETQLPFLSFYRWKSNPSGWCPCLKSQLLVAGSGTGPRSSEFSVFSSSVMPGWLGLLRLRETRWVEKANVTH